MAVIKNIIKNIFNFMLVVVSGVAITIKVAYLRLKKQPIIFVIGTPAHSNLGDQAIAVAELQFLQRHLPEFTIVEMRLVNLPVISAKIKLTKKLARLGDVIMGHGGGNMGDEYPTEEATRQLIIEAFPNHQIVIFPQTIFYKDTDAAQQMLAGAKEAYAKHQYLTLVAREQHSFEFMQQYFPKNKVLLVPDIVLSMTPFANKSVRHGAMTCLRQDPEKGNIKGLDQQIQQTLKEQFGSVNITDTVSNDRFILTNYLRNRRLHDKWCEFARAEVVVTDRLHGMVFAYLTQTPCVVFSNYNYKVSGTYQWIKQMSFIRFCQDITELEDALERVVKTPSKELPDLDKYWQQLAEEIRGGC